MCRRGHVESMDLASKQASPRCPEGGATVLTACPNCRNRIRGIYILGRKQSIDSYAPPACCDECGSPFPWAGRQARIYQLHNLLDEEKLDSATQLTVQEQLEALLNPELDEKEQARRWKRVKEAAPGFLEKAASQPIVASLLTAWLRKEVGLPPS